MGVILPRRVTSIADDKEIDIMPPKPRYTREQIIDAALSLVRESGAAAVTSRALGKRLGCSVCPIFTVFGDMDELNAALRERAWDCFNEYMRVAESFNPAYKKRGMQWVKFAQEEPNLFIYLFMNEKNRAENLDALLESMPFGRQKDIDIIMRDYRATSAQAEHLFYQMWTYTYGLCALCATGVCAFTEEEISQRLGEIFRGMVYILRSGDAEIVLPAMLGSAQSAAIQSKHPDLGQKG